MNKHEQNLKYNVFMGVGGTIGQPEEVFPLGSDTNPKKLDGEDKKAASIHSNLKAYIRQLLDENHGTGYAEEALANVPKYLFSEVGEFEAMCIPAALRSTLQFRFDEVNQSDEVVRTINWVSWDDIQAEHKRFNDMVGEFMKTAKLIPVNTGIEQDVKTSTNQPKAPIAVGAWSKLATPAKKTKGESQPKS